MIGGSDIARLAEYERRARQQAEADAWPEGTIARYLTVGGATVDLTESSDEITSTCGGCPATYRSPFDPMCEGRRMEDYATRHAHAWAQAHAEKCRALPRPEVTS